MAQHSSAPTTVPSNFDRLTLVALSALAYIIAVALHEHLGHTLMCIMLGSHPTELGAFYVDCDYTVLSDLGIRLVAIAGPVVSFGIGLVSFYILRYFPSRSFTTNYFVWLLGSIGLMTASGYMLFSGISGIGDLGVTRDGVFYQVSSEWLLRMVLVIVGMASYFLVVRFAVREIDPFINGVGSMRIRYGRQLTLTSYLTGAAVYIIIGLFNPHGLIIVVVSAAASSLGATSGLLWMMRLLDRDRQVLKPELTIQRSWWWIALGGTVTLIYALILGPTLRF